MIPTKENTIIIDYTKPDFPTQEDIKNIKLSQIQSEEWIKELFASNEQYDFEKGLPCERNLDRKFFLITSSYNWLIKNTAQLVDVLWRLKDKLHNIKSKNDIRNMIKCGGVKVDDIKIQDEDYFLSKIDLIINNREHFVIKYGKLDYFKFQFD